MSDAEDQSTVKADEVVSESRYRPLRVWPPLLLIALAIASQVASPYFMENGPMFLAMATMMAPMFASGLILIWWLALSRATILERVVGLVGVVAAAGVATALADPTMHGPGIMFIALPLGTGLFAMGAVICRRYAWFNRTIVALLLATCGFGFVDLLRSDGMWGSFAMDLHWRWTPSADDALLARIDSPPPAAIKLVSAEEFDQWLAEPSWPRFRGPEAISRQHGSRIDSDWKAKPPELLWKIPIGPGWSSFSVAGNLLFTQEQHGEQEVVACYLANSGKEVWRQGIESRFFDPLGGPGPRATPTLADGGLFVQGASGHVQRLDPRTGDLEWSQDLRQIAGREPPMWGFSSSPLVVAGVAIVHAGGAGDKGVVAFDVASGDLVWSAPSGDHSYSSPHLAEVAGRQVVLMVTNAGMNILDPATGKALLNYEWEFEGHRTLQPQVIDGDSVLIATTGMGVGTRRVTITSNEEGLTAEEDWTSRNLKPDFNDFVVHGGYIFGFDGSMFTCVDLTTGERAWKGGRYGKGQVLLLSDSDLLLVATEFGEVVLLKASADKHEEVAKLEAIDGKTWNHPVVVGDRLYIRNSQEAACYRLPLIETEVAEPSAASGT